ncbi:hypothetical protein RQP46_001682 [Phenoliferia psychrophenolica]
MYLRWTRFFFFQLTSALCLATVGLAGWGLSYGLDKKAFVKKTIPGATLDITDALGVGGAVTGVASLLCLLMMILGQFWAHRPETITTVRMKEGAFGFAVVFWLATLIPATYIMATKSGVVSKAGVPAAVIANIVKLSGQNLAYKSITPIKSYVIVGWIAFLSTCVNLVLVSLTARYIHKNGPDVEQGELVGHRHHDHATSSLEKSAHEHESPKTAHESEQVSSTTAEKV